MEAESGGEDRILDTARWGHVRGDGRDGWSGLLEALEDPCASCAGRGTVTGPEWKAWYERAEELDRVAAAARRAVGLDGTDFDDAAPAPADGPPAVVTAVERAIEEHEASRPRGRRHVACPVCNGTGRVLTAFGARLADLLARHGFVRDPAPLEEP